MGRSRSKRSAPSWAYEDNPFSKFGMIYADMLKSKKYQELSCSTRQFLTVCIVHSSTEKAKECLYNALNERYTLLGTPKNEHDLNLETYDENKKLFVFPKKHYEEYGYTKAYVYKCFKELQDKGFLKIMQNGKNSKKVNIYEFSTEWKKK